MPAIAQQDTTAYSRCWQSPLQTVAKRVLDVTIINGNRRFRVLALTDNVPLLTAWANDASYDDVFSEQLLPLISKSDIALAISGSGNSPNVLKALQVAREPDPAIYRLAAERLFLSTNHLFAVEDSVCGVRAAKSAGLSCLGLALDHAASSLRRAGAEHVIPDLIDISLEDLDGLLVVASSEA